MNAKVWTPPLTASAPTRCNTKPFLRRKLGRSAERPFFSFGIQMKKLLPAQRFTPNFLLLKPGVVGGYRPEAEVLSFGKQTFNV